MRSIVKQAKRMQMVSLVALFALSMLGLGNDAVAIPDYPPEKEYGDNFSGDPQNVGPLPELFAEQVNQHDLSLGEVIDFETQSNIPPESYNDGDDGLQLQINGTWQDPEGSTLAPGETYSGSVTWNFDGEVDFSYGYYVWADTNGDGQLDSELLNQWCDAIKPDPQCPSLGNSGLDQTWSLTIDSNAPEGSHGYIRSMVTESPSLPILDDDILDPINPGFLFGVTSVVATSDGGSIVVGDEWESFDNENMWIVKTDLFGNILWERLLGAGNNYYEQGFDIIETVDTNGNPDGYLAVGAFISPSRRIFIVKLDLSGQIQWQRNVNLYPGATEEAGTAVIQTSDSERDFVILARSVTESPYSISYRLMRIDRNNPDNIIFDVRNNELNHSIYPVGMDLIESKDGNGNIDGYVVTGSGGFDSNKKFVVAKYDTEGDLVAMFLSPPLSDVQGSIKKLVQKGNGGNYWLSSSVNGHIGVKEFGFSDVAFIADLEYPNYAASSDGSQIKRDEEGDYYLTASTNNANGDGVLIKVNDQGVELGSPHYFGGDQDDDVKDLSISENGQVHIIGLSESFGTIHKERWRHVYSEMRLVGGEVEDYEFTIQSNQAPIAVDDSASTTEGVAVDIDVLANDSDPEGQELIISGVNPPAEGTVWVIEDSEGYQTLRFTPTIDVTNPIIVTFTYTLADFNGQTDTGLVSVTVNPVVVPPTLSFSAKPAYILPGQTSTLSWQASGATSCTASGAKDWTGAKPTKGSKKVSPTITTGYSLTCTGPGGSVTKSAKVTVGAPLD